MSNYTRALFFIFILGQLTIITRGHSQGWNVYTSTEDRFTVAVPSTVQISKMLESKEEATLDSAQRERLDSYISYYEDSAAPQGESKFRIVVINGKAKIFDSLSRSGLVTYLSVMIIGDDDEPRPTTQKVVTVNGLTGKEYVWSMKAKTVKYGWTAEIFTRGRIFDQGDKIYVIVFIGDNGGDLKSRMAERFLNSFRLEK